MAGGTRPRCRGRGKGGSGVKAAELLTVDVDSELRTLCSQQLQGSWQLPAELIRFAIRHGASSAELERGRRGFVLRCPGTACSAEYLSQVASALDVAQADEDRHGAVVALEEDGAQALLWFAGCPGSRVQIAVQRGDSATVLEARPDGPPRLETDAAVDVVGDFEVRFDGPDFDVKRSMAWVRTACRFAPITVTVDNAEVVQGFNSALHSVSLGRPLPGGIALTSEGDAPHLWLLRRGVLSARAIVPGYPPFEAVLELGDVTPEGVTPDELRRAVDPHLPDLMDQAARIVIDAIEDGPHVDQERASRLVTLSLVMVRKGLRSDHISKLPVIPCLDGTTGARRNLSLADLRRISDQEPGPLWSVPPDTKLAGLPAGSRTVLLLTPEQHGLLTELLPGGVQRPEPRHRPGRWRSLVAESRRRIAQLRSRVTGSGNGRILKHNELLQAERDFVGLLGGVTDVRTGEPVNVGLCAGVGEIRRHGEQLLLPRNNPLVVDAIRLSTEDESWLYPSMLALLFDQAAPPPDLARRFRERLATRG